MTMFIEEITIYIYAAIDRWMMFFAIVNEVMRTKGKCHEHGVVEKC